MTILLGLVIYNIALSVSLNLTQTNGNICSAILLLTAVSVALIINVRPVGRIARLARVDSSNHNN
jgi:hypothetical protein